MVEDNAPEGQNAEGVSAGSLVVTMLDYLERKQTAPSSDEADMLVDLVLTLAERIDYASMDEVITVLGMLPGISDAARAKLGSRLVA